MARSEQDEVNPLSAHAVAMRLWAENDDLRLALRDVEKQLADAKASLHYWMEMYIAKK